MTKFIAVVECAIEHEGKFLVIERPQGTHAGGLLSFPGGKVELSDGDGASDVLVQAIQREVYEEVGLNLGDSVRYVTSSCFVDDSSGDYVLDAIFHCRMDEVPDVLAVCPREVPRYYWLAHSDILKASNCPAWLERYLTLTITLTQNSS